MLREVDKLKSVPASVQPSVVIVGAGIGGLVAALQLADQGLQVTVVEKAERPGGKLREVVLGGHGIDSGPTVFTMPWIFETIFENVGENLQDHLHLTKADILARHSWEDGSTLDLFAETEKTVDAIERFAGSQEARGYLAFCKRTGEVFRSLNSSFMENPEPTPVGLARSAGLGGLAALTRIKPFTSLWNVAGQYFRDPRLRQLFGRYATYCGSSPFEAPGPLMLIAHVEQMGVWFVTGGMARIAEKLENLARNRGAVFRYGEPVSKIDVRDGIASGVTLSTGEVLEADSVVFNGDPAALFSGLLGKAARNALPAWSRSSRSMSALTWSIRGEAAGFPLSRHTVFFSNNYRREFDDIFGKTRTPENPTIYVCAQDRDESGSDPATGPESLFLLVNAPSRADTKVLSDKEIAACETQVMERLDRAGLTITAPPEMRAITTPSTFETLFPATGGALYGRVSHGWAASFQRPGARTKIKGLYLAGGAVHPGPGIPMAALSGSNAAKALAQDLASRATSHPTATHGGTSMRSARTGQTHSPS